jgi:ABC-2 type transport system permease protein
MRIVPVVRKELSGYFNSPIAYIVVIAFLVFTTVWVFYLNQFFSRNEASLRIFFQVIPTAFIFLVPALTMRSWAEERKSGTLEILLTLPFKEAEVVAGKFLGALTLLAIMIILTLPLPLSLSRLGFFDAGQVFGEYLGVLLVGASGLSIGLLISALSANQVSAYVLGGIALLVLTLASQLNTIMSLPAWLAAGVNWITFDSHYESFRRGILDTRDISYFLLIVVLFLYLNTRVLVRRKWS